MLHNICKDRNLSFPEGEQQEVKSISSYMYLFILVLTNHLKNTHCYFSSLFSLFLKLLVVKFHVIQTECLLYVALF